jgi:hypothetical protein
LFRVNKAAFQCTLKSRPNFSVMVCVAFFLGTMLASLLSAPGASAAIVRRLDFSARLRSSVSDTVVPDGTYTITFSLYIEPSDMTTLWTETQSLAVTNGVVSTSLGSVTPFPASVTFNGDSFYLGIQVGDDPEMRPRKQISSVPMAFNANRVNGVRAGTRANNVLKLNASGNINIQGGATLGSALNVAGDINASGGVLKIAGRTVCTANGCDAAASSGNYIQNGTSVQTASFAIQPASDSTIAAVIRGAADQSANLQEWQDSTGAILASISSSGVLALPANGLNVGSGQLQVTNNNVDIANTLTVGSNIDATSGVLKVAGITVCTTSGCTAASGSGDYIQNGTSIQSASLAIQPAAGTDIGIVVKANASQSANLQEWQDSSGTALATISPSGVLTLPSNSLAVGGTQLVASGGNVGIGTNNPIHAKLQVTQTAGSGALSLTASGTGTTGLLWDSGTYGFIDYNTSSSSGVRYSALGPLIFGSNTNAIYGSSTFSEKMRLTAGGNLGIGTMSPQQALTLASSDNFGIEMASPGAPTVTPFTSGGSISDNTYYYKVVAVDGAGGTTVGGTESSAATVSGGGGSGSVALSWTAISGAASYTVYRTTTSGTYTTPTLIAAGITTASYTDTATSTSAGAPPSVTTAMYIKISSSGDSWINNGGKLGIATASPTEKLTVNGNINASGTNGSYITANYVSNAAAYLQTWNRGGDITCGGDYRGALYFGVKMTDPGTLTGSPCTQTVSVQPTLTPLDATNPNFGIEAFAFNRLRFVTHAATSSFTEDTWTEAMSILGSGNIGIGKINPANLLQVSKTAITDLATSSQYAFDITQGSGELAIGTDSSNAYIQSFNSMPLILNNQGNNVIITLTAGSVGIGTATPQQALTLVSGDNFAIEMVIPAAPTLTPSSSGGSLADGTYFYKIVALDSAGGTTAGGTEASTTVSGSSGNGSVALTWTAINSASSYRIYRGTSTGGENVYYTSTAASLTDTNAASTGGTPPTVTTAYTNKLSASGNSWINAGNVGVNQASPTERLEVASSIKVSGGGTSFVLSEGTTGCTNNTFHIGTSRCSGSTPADDMFTVQSDGKIGISTGTPASLLTISGGSIGAHIELTQTTAPTIGTPSSCGTGSPTASIGANSTDANGSFTITAGTGVPGNCAVVITYNTTYGATPKSIILTSNASTAPAKQIYVSASASGTFTATMAVAPAADEVNTWFYWVTK